jgi:hypothetical protein
VKRFFWYAYNDGECLQGMIDAETEGLARTRVRRFLSALSDAVSSAEQKGRGSPLLISWNGLEGKVVRIELRERIPLQPLGPYRRVATNGKRKNVST